MKTVTQAVADAFKTVSGDASYRGRWLLDSDYAAIIRLEYGLQSNHLLSHNLLNKCLSRDRRFKTADDTSVGNGAGTFRDTYTPDKLPERVYMIKNQATGLVEAHPARVWNEATQADRYESFKKSEAYREFQRVWGTDKTIGEQRFRGNLCNCVREATPLSCVDLLESGLQEYMTAINNASHLRPAIKRIGTM